MRLGFIVLTLLLSAGASAEVGNTVTTSREVVGEIRVDANDVVYFTSDDKNWSAPNCPNAEFVYFHPSYAGGDKTYSAALASKVSKTPIAFKGICGDGNGNGRYIQLTYMIF